MQRGDQRTLDGGEVQEARPALPAPGLMVVDRLARRLRRGTLNLRLPDGSSRRYAGPEAGPAATLELHNWRLPRRYFSGGSVGFAESYIDGDWDSPDLAGLLELLDRNSDAWGQGYYGKALTRLAGRVAHAFRRNHRRGSERNIHAHYDLGNDFFSAWLDPTMTYSSARFTGGNEDLETAQREKYRSLARLIGLAPGHRLLEIGSGWGGFAITAAQEFGAEVHSITISREQHAFASRRVQELGLGERVTIDYRDYRDVRGPYDRVASIEMFEAVGEAYWPIYFGKLREVLLPGGIAGLQIITIADQHFASYRRSPDFIQRYIFPGGMLPSPGALRERIAAAGLELQDQIAFGACYARTLALWAERFHAAWDTLDRSKFDARFRRIWDYYLAYCEAGFRTGSTDVVQLAVARR
ncbi:MAG: cyclopropane-fatty-acyl-phospholipid synthase family protein [Geminicoccaceae bacterium]